MGERAPSVPGVVLDLGTRLGLAARQGLALTRELHRRWCWLSRCPVSTVYPPRWLGPWCRWGWWRRWWWRGGGGSCGTGPRWCTSAWPPAAASGWRRSRWRRWGRAGGGWWCGAAPAPAATNHSSVLGRVDQSERSIHLQSAQQQRDQQRAGQRGREPDVGVLLVLRDSDSEILYVVFTIDILYCHLALLVGVAEAERHRVDVARLLLVHWPRLDCLENAQIIENIFMLEVLFIDNFSWLSRRLPLKKFLFIAKGIVKFIASSNHHFALWKRSKSLARKKRLKNLHETGIC